MKPYIASLILFLIIFSSTTSLKASSNDDLNTLLKLKSGLLGPRGSGLQDWQNFTISHCNFSGVTCNENGNVVSLHISSYTLKGTLLPEIGNLGELVNLTLTCTAVGGQLPVQLAGLPYLRYLNVSNNNFSGPFPDVPGGFQDLRILDAYNNMLSGYLPNCLADVPELMYLQLGGNYISGAIPESYAGIENLEYLSVNGNNLSGRIPPSLGQLSKLQQLYLGYFNVYEGGIPSEFGNLTNLVRLDLGGCNLSGPIPASFGRLSRLDSLFLQMNNLSGTIPPELGQLSMLKSLDLSVNELTGEIPGSLEELKSVKLINLFSNHLCGSIPLFIAELPDLEVLELWENNFTMELPPKLGMNGRLTKLDVATNRLTGQIPEGLCDGGQLQLLVLMENALFGPIPEKLGDCKSLTRIRLAKNYLNGTIPAKWFDLPKADMLELSDNLFSGELPKIISAKNISNLLLSNNLITGSIPASIGNLHTLQNLALESNQFTGEIPPQIGHLTQLSKLNLSGNSLSGEIPVELTLCTSLVSIDLSRNNLAGRIPEELTTMPILNTLNLSRNQFSGEIPNEIQRMRSLTVLDLSYNNLTGTIPAQGQFVVFNTSAFVGNPGLCPSGSRLDASGTCATDRDLGSGNGSGEPCIRGVSIRKYLLILGVVIALVVMLGFGGTRAWTAWKNNQRRRSKAWKMTAFQRLNFTVEDVMECLKDDNVIGKGGAGIVYRGSMNNGTEVAIKRLVGRGAGCGNDRGFTAEVTTLGQIRHRNIVRLLGFVSNRETNLLLYKYMPNGSLGEMLHGSKGAHLGWESRWRIATEAARGLCYLHHDCSPPILHRDVKSNNILLDSGFEAHVADFGLAKFLQDSGVSECVSSIAGSYGYIAPEYAYTLRVDEKSDVYSFGVVLLELVTGRRPVGGFGEGVDIVQWVRKTTGEVAEPSEIADVLSIVDSRLTASPLNLIISLYKVAMMCVEEKSDARPAMREVVHLLSNVKAMPHLLTL